MSKDNGVTVNNAIIIELTSGQEFDLKKEWTLDDLLAYINEKEAKKTADILCAYERLEAKFQLDVGIMLENNKEQTDALIIVADAIIKLYPCYIKGQPCSECRRFKTPESCPAYLIFKQKNMETAILFSLYGKLRRGEIRPNQITKIRRINMFREKTFNGKKDCSGYGKPETPPKEAKCLICRDVESCKEKADIRPWE